MRKAKPKLHIECNGKLFRSIEQLYNCKHPNRTMTVQQAMWFLEDNGMNKSTPSGKRPPSALGKVDVGPDHQPL